MPNTHYIPDNPGPELDAEVEQIVFQRKVSKKGDMQWTYTDYSIGPIEKYSTTWEGMRLVVEEMKRLGWSVNIEIGFIHVMAEFYRQSGTKYHSSSEFADNAPHAVASAAIKAIRGGDKSMP